MAYKDLCCITQKQNYSRKNYLDIAKGIGIVLVVLGHCPQVYDSIKQWIYAFHMPLFFVIGGLAWVNNSNVANGLINKKFFLSKLKRLIIPCYFWAIIYSAVSQITEKNIRWSSVLYLLYGSQIGFKKAGSLTSLWFLTCMFLTVCLFEIVLRVVNQFEKQRIILFAVSVCFCVIGFFIPHLPDGYPWGADVVMISISYLIWGYLVQPYLESIIKSNKLGIAVCLLCACVLTLTFRYNLAFISIKNVDMASRQFGKPTLYLLDSLAGSLFVLSLSGLLDKLGAIRQLFIRLGKHSLAILLLHKPIAQTLDVFLQRINMPRLHALICDTIATILLCELIYFFTVKYVPFVYGNKR